LPSSPLSSTPPSKSFAAFGAATSAEPSLSGEVQGVPALESLEPFTAKSDVAARSSSLGRGQRWGLIALGALGLLVTLHRNDVLAKLARSVGGESGYKSFHDAFGGPSTQTPQGLRAFAAALPSLAPPESLKPRPAPPRAPEPPAEVEAPSPARAAAQPKTTAKSDAKSSPKKKAAKGAKAKAANKK
jgi:hypothetical protein